MIPKMTIPFVFAVAALLTWLERRDAEEKRKMMVDSAHWHSMKKRKRWRRGRK